MPTKLFDGVSALADLLLEFASIGSVLTSSHEDNKEREVYGILSVINLSQHRESREPQKSLFKYIQTVSKQYSKETDKFNKIITSSNVGVLINERMMNIPPWIIPQVH